MYSLHQEQMSAWTLLRGHIHWCIFASRNWSSSCSPHYLQFVAHSADLWYLSISPTAHVIRLFHMTGNWAGTGANGAPNQFLQEEVRLQVPWNPAGPNLPSCHTWVGEIGAIAMSHPQTTCRAPLWSGFWGRYVPWGFQLDEVLDHSSTHHADLQSRGLTNLFNRLEVQ